MGLEGSWICTSLAEGEGGEGSVSIGLMQATLGEMKSFRVSVERMADMVARCAEVEEWGALFLFCEYWTLL